MSRVIRVVLASAAICTLSALCASAQDAACKPLYDAALKALDHPGVERTITIGDPARPTMRLVARKTVSGWYQKANDTPWRPMPVSPDDVERRMLQNPDAFTTCVAGATEDVAGEAARRWTYVTRVGPAPTTSTIWISVSRGLPIRVQGDRTLQTSTYSPTPFPKP